MTTQHTHQEHNDVDATVGENPSVPDTTMHPDASETTTPEAVEVQANASSPEPITPVAAQAESLPEPPAQQSEVQQIVSEEEKQQESQTIQDSLEEQKQEDGLEEPEKQEQQEAAPTTTQATSTAQEIPVETNIESVPFSYQENENKEEEVRPFTAFIEEFRLAEAQARLNVTLPEAPISSFELVTSVEEQIPSTPQAAPFEASASALIQEEPVAEPAEKAAESIENAKETIPTPPIIEVPVPSISPAGEEGEASKEVSAKDIQIKAEEANSESIAPTDVPVSPPERAVSPLLRPSTRVRSSRHARHQREEATTASETATPVPQEQSSEQPVAQVAQTTATTQPEQSSVQTPTPAQPAAPEQPRPARRYRFDRPAASNGSVVAPQPASPARAEENKAATEPQNELANTTFNGSLPSEQVTGKTQSQEVSTNDSPASVTTPAPESGRRRQSHERQKETATPPVNEVTTPVAETQTPPAEVAPEDLPPLEYSELQKTTTRRRRRHRSSSSNGTTASTAAQTPAEPAAPTPTTQSPAPAATTRSTENNYSIVSGYTLNQMNMGKDMSKDIAGPFMGPEPSPARGSVLSRDSRTGSRAEAHRSPTPLYPHRTEGISATSLNHLANTFAQAIQTQTDRMVAELRRSSQAPANVSVTLPPFPSTERVGVFVDVANLLYSARTLRMSVDFGKLLDFLRGNRRLVRAQAYCPTSPQAGDEQMFLQAVKGLGYRITTKNYKTFSSGAKKADLDLDLCMDVVRLVDGRAVDCVVLVSGDSDFMPMLDYCSDKGVRVEVAAFDEAMSATLRQSCDLFINLSMLEEIRS